MEDRKLLGKFVPAKRKKLREIGGVWSTRDKYGLHHTFEKLGDGYRVYRYTKKPKTPKIGS